MKRSMILILQYVMVCITSPLFAQKIVPFTFSYETDSSTESSLEVLTEVNESTSTFIRLYFKGTHLGKESYLLLEATDGAKQQLRNKDLENWNFSSAYFNGSNVKVSLFSGKGELNNVFINAIKVSDVKIETSNRKATEGRENLANQPTNINSAINYDLFPYAAAVGRFTNGNTSYGTGWIAPNGAIVTSQNMVHGVTNLDRDIIEFNVPPSNSYGSVNHPGPEDQYPVKYNSETQSIIGFAFKRKHHYNVANEDNNSWNTTWGILEALPNSTGLRPGERQQQFFRIAPNLGSFTLNSVDVWVDIFHYGETNEDLLDNGTKYRTLKRHSTKLVPQDEYIGSADNDIESYMVYNLDEGNLTFTDSDTGAPITFNDHNIAMGVHTDFYNYAPAVGAGFTNEKLLTSLNDYFSSEMVYVDQGSEWDTNTGAIDKPYFKIWDGIEHAEIGGIVNIVKGNYNEPMYITKRVTLKAPVGHVLIGEGGALNARKATLPQEFFMEQEADNLASGAPDDSRFDLKSFPNPFTSSTDINYEILKSTSVRVSVFDKFGNKVRSLLQEFQEPGIHSVIWDGAHENGTQATPGLYVIRIETAPNSRTVKVIKN